MTPRKLQDFVPSDDAIVAEKLLADTVPCIRYISIFQWKTPDTTLPTCLSSAFILVRLFSAGTVSAPSQFPVREAVDWEVPDWDALDCELLLAPPHPARDNIIMHMAEMSNNTVRDNDLFILNPVLMVSFRII